MNFPILGQQRRALFYFILSCCFGCLAMCLGSSIPTFMGLKSPHRYLLSSLNTDQSVCLLCRKTAPKHDASTIMLPSRYSLLWMKLFFFLQMRRFEFVPGSDFLVSDLLMFSQSSSAFTRVRSFTGFLIPCCERCESSVPIVGARLLCHVYPLNYF